MMKTDQFLRRAILLWPALLLWAACSSSPKAPVEPPPIPIKSLIVKRSTFQAAIRLFGTVQSASVLPILAPAKGTVHFSKRFALGLIGGEAVRKGEPLFIIENQQVLEAVQQAQTRHDYSKAGLERARISFTNGWISKAQLDESEMETRLSEQTWKSAMKAAQDLTVLAGESGKLVVDKQIANGSEVADGAEIASIVDLEKLTAEGYVSRDVQGKIKPGLSVVFKDASGIRSIGKGVVREVSAVLGSGGSARVVCQIAEGAESLVVGDQVQMEVQAEKRDGVVSIPDEALVPVTGGYAVYVLESQWSQQYSAARRDVQIGGRDGSMTEIIEGLREGERIATSGQRFLYPGAIAQEAKTR